MVASLLPTTQARAASAMPFGGRRTAVQARSLGFSSSSFAAPRPALWQSSAASKQTTGRQQLAVYAGNHATTGPFAPIVVVVRNVMGVKPFNQLRGKAISLHSQVIKDFCKQLGADGKQVQGLIRLAKKNGEKLGFLA
ncbi:hypothetical protein N2152v2_001234 [Parachlorella kessleri]